MRNHFLALLPLVAAAVLADPAHGVTLNPRGLGQALVYPYYTVNKGQDTLLTVVNDGDVGAVGSLKVYEGYNGRPMADVHVFLAPHDVWTARVSALADGGGALFTADTSCTYPPIPATGLSLRASTYSGGSIFPADGGPVSITRTREGYVQVVEFGAVIPGSPLDLGIRHPAPDTAPTCDSTNNAAGAYLATPGGTLGGSAAIVNVAEGTFFAYPAAAIAAFTDNILFSGSAQYIPNELVFANNQSSAFPGGAIAEVASGDDHFALDFDRGINAVSAVFMQETIANDYLVAAGLGAHTDWVVTFPTKALYTDPFHVPGPTALAPFTELFHAPGVSNVLANAIQYDQEEGHGATSALTLPHLVNVISFHTANDDASGVLGSALATNIVAFSDAGTMTLDLAHGGDETHTITAPDGHVLHGLPATGFMVYNIINANAAPGKLANYGGAFPYRSTVACTTSVDDSTACQ